jgi:hypothetical protein
MAKSKPSADILEETEYRKKIAALVARAPWVLRVTELKDKTGPVLIAKERYTPSEHAPASGTNGSKKRETLRERGLLYGAALRRCIPVIRHIVSGVCDEAGVPLELQRHFSNGKLTFRGTLPLNKEAGAKLSLIFKLSERILDMDRVELIAWRVERFSPEEAMYWLTRITQYDAASRRWAQAGMRIMLGGQPGDKEIPKMLERLRK